ncbi:probable putative exochitinase [Melanopsichium pennsylvanicum]|uniref:beta-N-acetylhexosaminidase n=2 Tax=Melanopsichium pennsylvanicum TaxID=63383 RepID=A0AAJ4XLC9_9BASI|nr:putative exochitinase [Melanopsichium pennsylvanicum 4]SNX84096.1 probable putative exochitinase [Melanopsichium pennsylvanicum]
MWLPSKAPLLAGTLLFTSLSAHALWPYPTNVTQSKVEQFVRIAPSLSFTLVQKTDKTRVPSDLNDAINAAAALANSIDLWEVSPDRGANYVNDINLKNAPTVASVQIKVLELMPETMPNPCVKKDRVQEAVGSVDKGDTKNGKRSSQAPFQGRKKAGDALKNHPEQQRSKNKGSAFDDVQSSIASANVWANSCSISNHAIRELSYNVSSKSLNLESDTSAPSDLGFLDGEMYRILIPSDGSPIQLTSYTSIGALRGLQTLLQTIYALPPSQAGKIESQRFIRNVPITISDRPAYPYRGLLLDTARNWFDVPTILKLIDTMSFVKLNQFHWHATDTQSFPLAFADDVDANSGTGTNLSVLAEKGSYGWTKNAKGEAIKMVYTEHDVATVIDYAAKKGVNVIIETDMPAHMLEGVDQLDNGELMACPDASDWQTVAAEPPSGQLRLVSNWTASKTTDLANYKIPQPINNFVSTLLQKVSSLSKSLYVSSGGDEPNFACWNLSSEAIMEPYLTHFMSLVTNVTSANGKKGMVWEEMAVKFPSTAKTLAPGSLVEIWNDANNSRIALTNNPNVNIVLAPVDYFYLDCGAASFLGNSTANLWCAYVSWQKSYTFSPAATIANATDAIVGNASFVQNMTAKDVRERFVGGEHAIWSETIDVTNLESKAWPRAATASEIFWTGDKIAGTNRVDSDALVDALSRIIDLRYRLNQMGVNAEPLQPQWCAERPGMCNMQ